MKRFVFLTFAISTLIAPIQVRAQEYDAIRNCIRFLRIPNPEAETRYLLSHPAAPVCPASNPDLAGQAETVRRGMIQGYDNTIGIIRAQRAD